jgi:hypothetical protein
MVLKRNASRTILIEELSKGICKVFFRKMTNGRFRSIFGTLKPSLIPGKYQNTIIEVHKAQDDPNLLPFFDIKEGKWKSFYINNILSFHTEEEIRRK